MKKENQQYKYIFLKIHEKKILLIPIFYIFRAFGWKLAIKTLALGEKQFTTKYNNPALIVETLQSKANLGPCGETYREQVFSPCIVCSQTVVRFSLEGFYYSLLYESDTKDIKKIQKSDSCVPLIHILPFNIYFTLFCL